MTAANKFNKVIQMVEPIFVTVNIVSTPQASKFALKGSNSGRLYIHLSSKSVGNGSKVTNSIIKSINS